MPITRAALAAAGLVAASAAHAQPAPPAGWTASALGQAHVASGLFCRSAQGPMRLARTVTAASGQPTCQYQLDCTARPNCKPTDAFALVMQSPDIRPLRAQFDQTAAQTGYAVGEAGPKLGAEQVYYATRTDAGVKVAMGLWYGPMASGGVSVLVKYAPAKAAGVVEPLVGVVLAANRNSRPAGGAPAATAAAAHGPAVSNAGFGCPQALGPTTLKSKPADPHAGDRMISQTAIALGIIDDEPWIVLAAAEICEYRPASAAWTLLLVRSNNRAYAAERFNKAHADHKPRPATLGGQQGVGYTTGGVALTTDVEELYGSASPGPGPLVLVRYTTLPNSKSPELNAALEAAYR